MVPAGTEHVLHGEAGGERWRPSEAAAPDGRVELEHILEFRTARGSGVCRRLAVETKPADALVRRIG